VKRLVSISLAFVISNSAILSAHAAPSESRLSGLDLLNRVANNYADARSYYLESREEFTRTSEYEQTSQKTIMVAAEAPEGRYYFEGRSSSGSSIEVADGQEIWDYRIDEHRYTLKPEPSHADPSRAKGNSILDAARTRAVVLKRDLSNYTSHLKSAERLPDETLQLNGHAVSCFVVRIRSADEKRPEADYIFDRTIWIDKSNDTFVRAIEHAHGYESRGSAHIPYQLEINEEYPSTQLGSVPSEDLFKFTPPADAELVADLSSEKSGRATVVGGHIPPLNLKTANGKVTQIDSFRGKPVLIDFWATWCAACVTSLPDLAKLYEQAKHTDLVIVTVDQDEEATKADAFLKKKGYPWRNFHDGDGEIQKLMGFSGIPRTILIDAHGQVVYDGTGSDENLLRAALAKLGSQYLPLSQEPKAKHPTASE
jgi:thiol-disulfide isomerase/thioredoxin